MTALENPMDLAIRFIEEGYGVAIGLTDGGYVDVYCSAYSGKPVWTMGSYVARRYDRCEAERLTDVLYIRLSGGEYQPTIVRVPRDRILSVAPCFARPTEGWGK